MLHNLVTNLPGIAFAWTFGLGLIVTARIDHHRRDRKDTP